MSADAGKNYAFSTVLTPPSPATSGTSLVVQAGDGARFPTPPFNITINPANTRPLPANAETARCTAIATDTLTIIRAVEGSTARSVIAGDEICESITAQVIGFGQVNRRPANDGKIAAGHSIVVPQVYQIDGSVKIEIDGDGVLEVLS